MRDLLAGKANVDQLARRLGVLPVTVEGWRQDALGGVADALRRGSGKTERELERTVEKLRYFQNVRLAEGLTQKIGGFAPVHVHHRVPPGDGGLALGQAVVAAATLLHDRKEV